MSQAQHVSASLTKFQSVSPCLSHSHHLSVSLNMFHCSSQSQLASVSSCSSQLQLVSVSRRKSQSQQVSQSEYLPFLISLLPVHSTYPVLLLIALFLILLSFHSHLITNLDHLIFPNLRYNIYTFEYLPFPVSFFGILVLLMRFLFYRTFPTMLPVLPPSLLSLYA